jgi:hypothetical protein
VTLVSLKNVKFEGVFMKWLKKENRCLRHHPRASLLEVLVRKHIFLGPISSLKQVLRNIGFTFKATDSKRLIELGHVAISRVQFLRSYMQNLNAQNPLQCVYLDETWIFENGSVHRS